jgi:hypothetical protein
MSPDTFASAPELPLDTDTQCRLIGGGFSILVQMSLGVIAATSLYIKWRLEVPRRTFHIWFFDMSKQGTSGLVAHGLNMFFATVLSHSQAKQGDECAWYFLNFVFDTLLGVPLNWFFLRLLERVARIRNWTSLRTSGDYGDPPVVRRWALQLMSWMLIIAVTKTALAIPLYWQSGPVSAMGDWLFKPIQPFPKTELVVVMILSPGLLNVLQFWILDQILKNGGGCNALIPSCCSWSKTEQVPLLREGELGSTTVVVGDKTVMAQGRINAGARYVPLSSDSTISDSALVQRASSSSSSCAVESEVVARV